MDCIPQRGDIVWITLNPRAGHEQAGRRPALVLSLKAYNEKVGLAIFCPVTAQVKGYPFEVPIPDGLGINGVIVSDQVKNLDWQVQNAVLAGKLPDKVLDELLEKPATLT